MDYGFCLSQVVTLIVVCVGLAQCAKDAADIAAHGYAVEVSLGIVAFVILCNLAVYILWSLRMNLRAWASIRSYEATTGRRTNADQV